MVRTTASAAEVRQARDDLDKNPLVLTAPTAEARRVVEALLGAEPRPEVLLAPVRFPDAERGHRLDELVRRHALGDRFRDVVVVTDPATATLLLRVLAPDQAAQGSVTVVGLPRGDRPVAVRRALVIGVVLGVLAAAAERVVPVIALPGATAAAGLALLPAERWRHLGRGLLLASAVALVVVLVVIAGSTRFPGAW